MVSGPLRSPAVPADRRAVIRDGVGVGLATGAYGISFGALAVAGGLDILQTCALSLLMFTGASQFALVGVVSGGGSALAGAATASLLGSRNALYGLRLAPMLRLRGARRLAAAQFVLDETTAMALGAEDDGLAPTGFWATAAAVYAFWNLGTLIGAVAGQALPAPETLGLDAAVPAAFIALLAPRLTDRRAWTVAAGAALVALALTPVVGNGLPVLAAGLTAVVAGLGHPRARDDEADR